MKSIFLFILLNLFFLKDINAEYLFKIDVKNKDSSILINNASNPSQPIIDEESSSNLGYTNCIDSRPITREELDTMIASEEIVSDVCTSAITDMSYLFAGNTTFNQPLNDWDVSNVTNLNGIFQDATAFNQPLDLWNTSNVNVFSFLFFNATSFDQDISSWDTNSASYTPSNFATNSPIDGTNKIPSGFQ